MANNTYKTRVQLKNDTAENWAKAENFVPLKGEAIVYSDSNNIKIGDGETNVNDLDFYIPESYYFYMDCSSATSFDNMDLEAEIRSGNFNLAIRKEGDSSNSNLKITDVEVLKKISKIIMYLGENIEEEVIPCKSFTDRGSQVQLAFSNNSIRSVLYITISRLGMNSDNDEYVAENRKIEYTEDGNNYINNIIDYYSMYPNEGFRYYTGNGVAYIRYEDEYRGYTKIANNYFFHITYILRHYLYLQVYNIDNTSEDPTITNIETLPGVGLSDTYDDNNHLQFIYTFSNGTRTVQVTCTLDEAGEYYVPEVTSDVKKEYALADDTISLDDTVGRYYVSDDTSNIFNLEFKDSDDFRSAFGVPTSSQIEAAQEENQSAVFTVTEEENKITYTITGTSTDSDNNEHEVTMQFIIEKLDEKHYQCTTTTTFDEHTESYTIITSCGEVFNDINNNIAAENAHAEGGGTTASGKNAHAEGLNTTASGYVSHTEGQGTVASGSESHAEGVNTEASGDYSHAEGFNNTASENSSHAEGSHNTASGHYSHVEGDNNTASGGSSHAEGSATTASGYCTHSEGNGTTASGKYSHAEGSVTIAAGEAQHAQGRYNIEDIANTYSDIVGNGSYDSASDTTTRSNAYTLDWSGNGWYAGEVYVGSTSGTNRDDGSVRLANVNEAVRVGTISTVLTFEKDGSGNYSITDTDTITAFNTELSQYKAGDLVNVAVNTTTNRDYYQIIESTEAGSWLLIANGNNFNMEVAMIRYVSQYYPNNNSPAIRMDASIIATLDDLDVIADDEINVIITSSYEEVFN